MCENYTPVIFEKKITIIKNSSSQLGRNIHKSERVSMFAIRPTKARQAYNLWPGNSSPEYAAIMSAYLCQITCKECS
jgi:hypothetical protein